MLKNIFALIFLYGFIVSNCKGNQPVLDKFPEIGGNFTLEDTAGNKFSLSDLKGKSVLLFFGYTNCPDACSFNLSRLSAVYKKLGSDSEKVKTLFVTVDPARDTKEKMGKYLSYFKFNPIGLIGTGKEIDKVADLYKIVHIKRETGKGTDYQVDHSTITFLIDANGVVRYLIKQDDPVNQVTAVIRNLLSEKL